MRRSVPAVPVSARPKSSVANGGRGAPDREAGTPPEPRARRASVRTSVPSQSAATGSPRGCAEKAPADVARSPRLVRIALPRSARKPNAAAERVAPERERGVSGVWLPEVPSARRRAQTVGRGSAPVLWGTQPPASWQALSPAGSPPKSRSPPTWRPELAVEHPAAAWPQTGTGDAQALAAAAYSAADPAARAPDERQAALLPTAEQQVVGRVAAAPPELAVQLELERDWVAKPAGARCGQAASGVAELVLVAQNGSTETRSRQWPLTREDSILPAAHEETRQHEAPGRQQQVPPSVSRGQPRQGAARPAP